MTSAARPARRGSRSRVASTKPGADGVVGVLVDEDERAGDAVVGVVVGEHRRARAQRDAADVVEPERGRRGPVLERRHVELGVHRLHGRADRARRVLERVARAGAQRGLAHPATVASISRARDRRVSRRADEVAAADVEVVGEPHRDRQRRDRVLDRAVEGSIAAIVVCAPDGQHGHLSPERQRAARELAGVRALVVAPAARAGSSTGPAAAARRGRVGAHVDCSRCSSSGGPSYQGEASERSTTLSPCSAAIGITRDVGDVEALGQRAELAPRSRGSASSSQSTRSILFTHATTCLIPSSAESGAWRRDWSTMPAARVEQDQREVGGRGAGDHVARVALVARGVGDDERALRGLEEAVGDVDRDALLALGAQAVGDRGEVGAVAVARAASSASRWSSSISFASSSRRPISVDLPSSTEPAVARRRRSTSRSSPRACGPPSRPRRRGRRRASRRARRRAVAAISAITVRGRAASERTAPVTVMSPTVR